MPRYRVTAIWSVIGSVEVEAENEDAAREMSWNIPLGDFDDREYMDDSFEIADWFDAVEKIDDDKKATTGADDISVSPKSS